MPSKTSKTTRKHGTVTEISTTKNELDRMRAVHADMEELHTYWSTVDDEVANRIEDARRSLAGVISKYANYKSNGKADEQQAD